MEHEHIKKLVESINNVSIENTNCLPNLEEKLKEFGITDFVGVTTKLNDLTFYKRWFETKGGFYSVVKALKESDDYKELCELIIVDLGIDIMLKTEKNYYDYNEWDINFYAKFNGGNYHIISDSDYDLLKDCGGYEEEKEEY